MARELTDLSDRQVRRIQADLDDPRCQIASMVLAARYSMRGYHRCMACGQTGARHETTDRDGNIGHVCGACREEYQGY